MAYVWDEFQRLANSWPFSGGATLENTEEPDEPAKGDADKASNGQAPIDDVNIPEGDGSEEAWELQSDEGDAQTKDVADPNEAETQLVETVGMLNRVVDIITYEMAKGLVDFGTVNTSNAKIMTICLSTVLSIPVRERIKLLAFIQPFKDEGLMELADKYMTRNGSIVGIPIGMKETVEGEPSEYRKAETDKHNLTEVEMKETTRNPNAGSQTPVSDVEEEGEVGPPAKRHKRHQMFRPRNMLPGAEIRIGRGWSSDSGA